LIKRMGEGSNRGFSEDLGWGEREPEKGLGRRDERELRNRFFSKLIRAGMIITTQLIAEYSDKYLELARRFRDLDREDARWMASSEIDALADKIASRMSRILRRPRAPVSVAPPPRVAGRPTPVWAPPYRYKGEDEDSGKAIIDFSPEEFALYRDFLVGKGFKRERIEKISPYSRNLPYYREFYEWMTSREIEPRLRDMFEKWLWRARGLKIQDYNDLPEELKKIIRASFREFHKIIEP
jgi:hypothetical protein